MIKKVLFVDDNKSVYDGIEMLLDDYEVDYVSSGEEAISKVDSNYCCVIMDARMPGIGGIKASKEIKKKFPNLSIIMNTGHEGDVAKTEINHLDGFVDKGDNISLVGLVNFSYENYRLRLKEEDIQRTLYTQKFITEQVGNIIHDVKNHLSVFSCSGTLLGMEDDEEKRKKYAIKIENSAEFCGNLLRGALNLLNGYNSNSFESFEMREFLLKQVDLFSFFSNFKKISLESKQVDYLKVFLEKKNIFHIVTNLLSNARDAVYSSDKKEISLSGKDCGDYYKITVVDSGVGISDSVKEKMFDKFYTTKDGKNGSPSGNGMGMNLLKTLSEYYGGRVDVESEVGKGSSISVYLNKKRLGVK